MHLDIEETRLMEAVKAAFPRIDAMVNVSLMEALQRSLQRQGLEPVLRAHLQAAFDVPCLKDLRPRDIPRALRFIADLQALPFLPVMPPKPPIPLPPGAHVDGGLIVVNGRVELENDPAPLPESIRV